MLKEVTMDKKYLEHLEQRFNWHTREELYLDKKRFNNKGCLLWKKAQTREGYGMFRDLNKKLIYAHRAAMVIKIQDDIPIDMRVLHKIECNNRSCVNIEHLYIGTQLENIQDRGIHGNDTNTRGERNWSAKLKEKDIKNIDALLHQGLSNSEVAEIYEVNKCTISNIKARRKWKHVPKDPQHRI